MSCSKKSTPRYETTQGIDAFLTNNLNSSTESARRTPFPASTIGLSAFSRRLQVQERLTDQIRDCLHETLKPQGVAVCIEAQHLCMQMRGVQKQNSITTTSAFSGAFMEEDITRQEFMSLVKGLSR